MNREDDILTTPPSDPALEAMLDRALGPQAAPPGLAQRIVAQTAPQVAARQRPVAGRIGWFASPMFRAAAAVAIAALLGVATWLGGHEASEPVALDARLAQLNDAAEQTMPAEDALDYRMEMLDLQLAIAASRPMWEPSDAPLVDPMLDVEMDIYDLDPDALF